MFNKEESNKKRKISLKNIEYYKIGTFFLTSSLILMLNSPIKDNKICFVDKKLEYSDRVLEYKMTREYDNKILDLYNNFHIMIDGIIYPIEQFYITFNKDILNPNFHLINIKNKCTDILTNSIDKYEYNKVVKFRDTTAFIELLNSNGVTIDEKNKLIVIINKKMALNIINNWDGMIHNLVPETDAVENKDMLRRK